MNITVVLLAGTLGGLCLGVSPSSSAQGASTGAGTKTQAAAPATKAPVTAHPSRATHRGRSSDLWGGR